MLWRILQAHGGKLPDGMLVCFANTGDEHPATLDFVRDCGEAWGVLVHWLEYRRDEAGRAWAERVGHNSASRNGEPYEALLNSRAMLPNPRRRFCTSELKIRTIRRWCNDALGKHVEWTQVIGLRADEPSRVDRIMDPQRQLTGGREARNVAVPLHAAGVTKRDVMAFWAAQPFDLMLDGDWQGNCRGCFLKRPAVIAQLAREAPDVAAWWARMEAQKAATKTRSPLAARFRKDWPGGYQGIIDAVRDNPRLRLFDADDDGLDRHQSCDVGCGA